MTVPSDETARPTRLTSALIVNTADLGGGAERSAVSIMDGFEALGTRTQMAVGLKRTDDPRVLPLYASAHIDYRPYAKRHRQTARMLARHLDRAAGLEDFRHPFSRRLLELTGTPPDLVLCANLHGGYFDLRALPRLCERVPVALRLSDSWTFTGHCAVPGTCKRWERGCGSCPDLAIPPAIVRDATHLNWLRKRRILAASNLAIVSPSRWMLERAQRSLLGRDREAVVIESGVDTATFAPGSRDAARARLGESPEALVLLFVANGGSEGAHKDFATLRAAVLNTAASDPGIVLRLVVVGRDGGEEQISERVVISHQPYKRSRSALADHYRAADIYLHSAVQDTLPLTLLEALACGRPVISTNEGGTAESVDEGKTGLLVAPGRPDAMARALRELIANPTRRAAMGEAGRAVACARFDAGTQIAKLHAWCADYAQRRAAVIARQAGRAALPAVVSSRETAGTA